MLESLAGGGESLATLVRKVHSADLAEWMQDLAEEDVWRVFSSLDVDARAEVLEHAEDALSGRLVERLTPHQLKEVVETLPADEVVDLLALADEGTAEQVLRSVDDERARGLRELAAHAPDSAGGLMTTEVVSVPVGTRIGDAIKLIRTEGEEVEEGQGLFVLDGGGRPVGYVSDRLLLTHSIHSTVDEVMVEPIVVGVDVDQEEAATQIEHYGLTELAVVDAGGALVGSISADDAIEVLEEEASEDILKIVGASPVHQTRLPILERVIGRLPLQAVTVAGGLATAAIIDLALGDGGGRPTQVDLLRFVPIVIGLAGNVGIQSSTILVRAFATGEVEPDREVAVVATETLAGGVIGLICGGLSWAVIAATDTSAAPAAFPLAVGAAIAAAVTFAAMLGCVIPVVCRRTGIDPAVVAGPFLITVSDICGTALYLAVAHLMLER
ncbi:MAG: magnesium transporter [Planctomycetota bacterium]|nr:magnesium transporter [Planctomycetota bacterium]MDP6988548.1 magnesium transporter [Planctomycetota bacterium]